MGGLCSQKTSNPAALEPPKPKQQKNIEGIDASIPKNSYNPYDQKDPKYYEEEMKK